MSPGATGNLARAVSVIGPHLGGDAVVFGSPGAHLDRPRFRFKMRIQSSPLNFHRPLPYRERSAPPV